MKNTLIWDNITSFLAYNILMGNTDTNSQNYLLYRPVNSNIWYFICWDGDGCLNYYENVLFNNESDRGSWQTGVSNYWGMQLFNRMLRVAEYRNALADKMELLHTMITPELIASEVAKYRTVVDTFTHRMPDIIDLGCTLEQLELMYQNMPYDVNTAYDNFIDSLHRPMPFFLGNVEQSEETIDFYWGEAYSFEAELVHYTLQVATDWSFVPETLVYNGSPQLQINATLPTPATGSYYWRVTAQNESGYIQEAFDWFVSGDMEHHGIRRFHCYRCRGGDQSAMSALHYRHELKYLINLPDWALLQMRLAGALQRDKNVDSSGEYWIRSLYFDDYWNTAYEDKEDGILQRHKYRLRVYHCSDTVIHLERKSKYGQYIRKVSAPLNRGETEELMTGDYAFLRRSRHPLMRQFYFECTSRMMRPRVIVDYNREPLCDGIR